jgi:hypothetical protein
MSESHPYTRHISYRFEVLGEVIEIHSINGDEAIVSETRFNGQEDTHMVMPIERVKGVWRWIDDEDEFNRFVKYHGRQLAGAILKYINKYGVPDTEKISITEKRN